MEKQRGTAFQKSSMIFKSISRAARHNYHSQPSLPSWGASVVLQTEANRAFGSLKMLLERISLAIESKPMADFINGRRAPHQHTAGPGAYGLIRHLRNRPLVKIEWRSRGGRLSKSHPWSSKAFSERHVKPQLSLTTFTASLRCFCGAADGVLEYQLIGKWALMVKMKQGITIKQWNFTGKK